MAPAESPASGIPGGSTDPIAGEAVLAVGDAGGAGVDSDEDGEVSEVSEDSDVAGGGLALAGPAPEAAAPVAPRPSDAIMAEVVGVEATTDAFSTPLGRTLKDEDVAARLAAAWAVYPSELHQALADDL